jgi:hypothetical protein
MEGSNVFIYTSRGIFLVSHWIEEGCLGRRVGLDAMEREMSLVFAVGRKINSSAVQTVGNTHLRCSCNFSDITSKICVVARFVII